MDHVIEETNLASEMSPVIEIVPEVKAKPKKPRLWTLLVTVIAATAGGLIAAKLAIEMVYFVAAFIVGFKGLDPSNVQTMVQSFFGLSLVPLLFGLVPFQVGMIAVVLLAARLSKTPLKERIGFLPQSGRKQGLLKTMSMAGFTLSFALFTVIATSLFLGPPSADNSISHAVASGSLLAITITSAVLSIIPGLVEETLFRGYFQRRLLERWSPVAAVAVSTILFASMHLDSLQHILAVIPLGLVTGMLAYRTNSTKPGMVVHALHNFGAVAWGATATLLAPAVGAEVAGMIMLAALPVMFLIGLIPVITLFLPSKKQPVVATPVVEPRAVREPSFNFGVDSRLAHQMG
jgi:membrane protease YdiL (CAAX protease family)